MFKYFVKSQDCQADMTTFIIDDHTHTQCLYYVPLVFSSTETVNHVAFKAHLSQAVISPGENQRIVYDDVQLNLGGGYHAHLGGFVAPINGTYLFSVAVCSIGNHYIVLDLVKNDVMIGRVLAGDTVYNDCSSETTISELTAGDEVFVQHHSTVGDLIHVNENILNSFTGALLQAI